MWQLDESILETHRVGYWSISGRPCHLLPSLLIFLLSVQQLTVTFGCSTFSGLSSIRFLPSFLWSNWNLRVQHCSIFPSVFFCLFCDFFSLVVSQLFSHFFWVIRVNRDFKRVTFVTSIALIGWMKIPKVAGRFISYSGIPRERFIKKRGEKT